MNMNGGGSEILLDARQMEPPEPFVAAMNILRQLQAGKYLHMMHRRKPRLLYPELDAMGFTSHTVLDRDETYHILVWRDEDIAASSAVDACLDILAAISK